MRYSDNLNLILPEQHEFYNVDILNDSFKKIDSLIGDSVGYTVTQSTTNEYKEIIQEYNDGRKIITQKMNDGTIKQSYIAGNMVVYTSTITKSSDGTIKRVVTRG